MHTFVWYFWDISFITRILMFEHDTNSLFTFMQKFLKRYKGTLLSSEVSSGEFQLQYLALLCMAVIKSFLRKEQKIKIARQNILKLNLESKFYILRGFLI